jgi:predicted AAA+ superfamily ATPase
MWINRKSSKLIQDTVIHYPVLFLTGPRQAGKTSLLKKLFPDYDYLTFDLPSVAEQAEKNPLEFISTLKRNTIIDEVQYAARFLRYLKLEIDKKRINGRFILTGSQNFLLMKDIGDSLAGRCAIIDLYSLSFNELKNFKNFRNISEIDFILKGGYPQIWADRGLSTDIFYSSYLSTYLERDIRNLLNVGKLRDFERFLRALAIRSAQILSYSDLARDVGIAVSTAKEWISVLEASKQIYLLEPYYRNLGKRLIKSPKVYLNDVGLMCFLLGIENKSQLIKSPLAGAVWETFVFNEMIRYFSFKGRKPTIWYWRTRDGEEVDFIVEENNKINIFESKFSENPDKNDSKNIKKFITNFKKENIGNAGILCRTDRNYQFDKEDNIYLFNISILTK